ANVTTTAPENTASAIARLNPDGSLDTSFDSDGKKTVAFDLGTLKLDFANGVAIQPNGKIVVAGVAFRDNLTGESDMAVARLNADGSLEPSFDTDGQPTVGIDSG